MNKKIVFISLVGIISIGIIMVMNLSYDSLSRYPYDDPKARSLIKENLEKSEIEYIVEYQIDPGLFIKYVKAENFNVYHIDDYNELDINLYYLNNEELVDFTEKIIQKADISDVNGYTNEYYYQDLLYWYYYGDEYNPNSILIYNPNSADAYVDDDYTVSNRTPYNLVEANYINSIYEDDKVMIKAGMNENLQLMCNAITDELYVKDCGGLKVDKSYVSYNAQKTLYQQAEEEFGATAIMYCDLPGHSENQLGFALDFVVENQDNFNETKQYVWLNDNAYKYGFIQTYKEEFSVITNKNERANHFRYVGVNLAKQVQESDLSLYEVLNK